MIACCVLCLVKCLKNTIEWLTEWAFVYIAIYGVSFVAAGGRVAKMLADSGMGAVAQTTLVYPVINLGRLVGAAVGVGAGFLTLQTHPIADEWSQPVIGAFVGFAVTSVALSCVDAGNKSIFVCYCDAPELGGDRLGDTAAHLDTAAKNKKAATAPNQVEIVRP